MQERLARKLRFNIPEGQDAYNITTPFDSHGCRYIAARVEPREDELGSKAIFFQQNGEEWVVDPEVRQYPLQDPFVQKVNGELLFGGNEVWKSGEEVYWRVVFFRGRNIQGLRLFARGPVGVKGIRLVELQDGRIGLSKRVDGKIIFSVIQDLEGLPQALKPPNIRRGIVLDLFKDGYFGNVNEMCLLPDGKVGVIGHIARVENGHKIYHAMAFILNPARGEHTKPEIILRRSDFPAGDAKSAELKEVVYPAGLVGQELYVGASDAEAWLIRLNTDPFGRPKA